MRATLALGLLALLSLDVMPCGSSPRPPPPVMVGEGKPCGVDTNNQCGAGLGCCAPDPRVVSKPGTCVKISGLAREGAACGVTSGRCCGPSLKCAIKDLAKDGVCQKSKAH